MSRHAKKKKHGTNQNEQPCNNQRQDKQRGAKSSKKHKYRLCTTHDLPAAEWKALEEERVEMRTDCMQVYFEDEDGSLPVYARVTPEVRRLWALERSIVGVQDVHWRNFFFESLAAVAKGVDEPVTSVDWDTRWFSSAEIPLMDEFQGAIYNRLIKQALAHETAYGMLCQYRLHDTSLTRNTNVPIGRQLERFVDSIVLWDGMCPTIMHAAGWGLLSLVNFPRDFVFQYAHFCYFLDYFRYVILANKERGYNGLEIALSPLPWIAEDTKDNPFFMGVLSKKIESCNTQYAMHASTYWLLFTNSDALCVKNTQTDEWLMDLSALLEIADDEEEEFEGSSLDAAFNLGYKLEE
jgi:hypothetical protein